MSDFEIESIADLPSFAALEGEWWDLWARSSSATPFQAPAWLLPWWEAFAPGALCVVAARQHGRLVGLMPLYCETGPRGRRLLPIGISVSDFLDVLIDPDVRGVGHAMMAHLAANPSWDCLELTDLAPDAAALQLACPAACEQQNEPASACPVLALPEHPDELRQKLSVRRRRSLQMAHNRAKRRGSVAIIAGDAANCDDMLAELIRLHGTRWESRGEPGVLADPRVRRFHRTSAPRMMAAGLVRQYALSIAGEIAAAYYGFVHRGRAYAYLTGLDPNYAFESPGAILLGHVIEEAVREGAREFHFLRGREAYKYGWGAVDRWNRRRVLARTKADAVVS